MSGELQIPSPLHEEDSEVARALAMATKSLQNGKAADALQWLRTAAKTAVERGADARAGQLFQAAADLAARVSESSSGEPASDLELGSAPTVRRDLRAGNGEESGASLAEDEASKPSAFNALTVRDLSYNNAEDTFIDDDDSAFIQDGDELEEPVLMRESTMTSHGSFRVAVLADDDGALRLVSAQSDAPLPKGAMGAVLVARTPEDAERLRELLHYG